MALVTGTKEGAPKGFYWMMGRGQGDRHRRVDAIDSDHLTSRKFIDMNSQGSKCGEQADFKVDFARQLRELVAHGDYSKGAMYKTPKPRHVVASDQDVIGAGDIANRLGYQVYGYAVEDEELVNREHAENNQLLVSAQNGGFGVSGMFQAGYDHEDQMAGPQRPSDRVTFNEAMMNDDDQYRLAHTTQGVRTYDTKLWIGQGHQPTSSKMMAIPFNI